MGIQAFDGTMRFWSAEIKRLGDRLAVDELKAMVDQYFALRHQFNSEPLSDSWFHWAAYFKLVLASIASIEAGSEESHGAQAGPSWQRSLDIIAEVHACLEETKLAGGPNHTQIRIILLGKLGYLKWLGPEWMEQEVFTLRQTARLWREYHQWYRKRVEEHFYSTESDRLAVEELLLHAAVQTAKCLLRYDQSEANSFIADCNSWLPLVLPTQPLPAKVLEDRPVMPSYCWQVALAHEMAQPLPSLENVRKLRELALEAESCSRNSSAIYSVSLSNELTIVKAKLNRKLKRLDAIG